MIPLTALSLCVRLVLIANKIKSFIVFSRHFQLNRNENKFSKIFLFSNEKKNHFLSFISCAVYCFIASFIFAHLQAYRYFFVFNFWILIDLFIEFRAVDFVGSWISKFVNGFILVISFKCSISRMRSARSQFELRIQFKFNLKFTNKFQNNHVKIRLIFEKHNFSKQKIYVFYSLWVTYLPLFARVHSRSK